MIPRGCTRGRAAGDARLGLRCHDDAASHMVLPNAGRWCTLVYVQIADRFFLHHAVCQEAA